jgi:hypothetical protein
MSIKILSKINLGNYTLPTQDGLLGQILTTNGSGVVSFQNPTTTSNFYLTGLSFNTTSGLLTATVSGSSNVTVNLDGRYALTSHTHAYDNYQSWNLRTNGVQRTTIQSGGILDLTAGSSISLAYSAGGVVTVASTETLDSVTGRGDTTTNSINAGSANFTGSVAIGITNIGYKLHVGTDRILVDNIVDAGIRFRTVGVDRYSVAAVNADFTIIDDVNDVSRLYITSTGDISIGNTAPTQKLHITGNIRITGAIYDSTNSPGTVGQVLSSTATGTDWIDAPAGNVTGTGTGDYITKWSNTNIIADSTLYEAMGPSGPSIGLGTTSIDPSSILQINSTTQGVILPRMTTTQMNAIAMPVADGLMIYNTTLNKICYYDDTVPTGGWYSVNSTKI